MRNLSKQLRAADAELAELSDEQLATFLSCLTDAVACPEFADCQTGQVGRSRGAGDDEPDAFEDAGGAPFAGELQPDGNAPSNLAGAYDLAPDDYAGNREAYEPDDVMLAELDIELATAEDAHRYVETVTALDSTSSDDDDDTARFLTYRNYVGAVALIVRERYDAAPYAGLVEEVLSLPGVRRIQRRPLAELDRKRAARELRGAWAYELGMAPPSELFALDVPDLVMIANHTAGVHAHYAIYKACRALALALHMRMPDQHEDHLDLVEEQLIRRGLLPSPWDARCGRGGAPRSPQRTPHTFAGFPSGTSTCPNLWQPASDNMWRLFATALKTTRDRSRGFETQLDAWRLKNRSRKARAGRTKGRRRWVPYEIQDGIYAAMRPTNLLDFIYRLRRRGSYLDDSSFLNNRIGMRDAIEFNRDLLLLTRSTLHVIETLIERAAADDFLARTQEEFARRTNQTLLNWTFASRPR